MFRKFLNTALLALTGNKLQKSALRSGLPFQSSAGSSRYFDVAEPNIVKQWEYYVWPMIEGLDFSCVVDLAAGHGRNSALLSKYAAKIMIVDMNEECIDACKSRFGEEKHRFEFIKNDGYTLKEIPDEVATLVYCFDAMVHFEPTVVKAYLPEIYRILRPGGHGFCHHSNYAKNPGGDFRQNPHWRNFMSKQIFSDSCRDAGLDVISQKVISWDECMDADNAIPDLDCLTLFRKS